MYDYQTKIFIMRTERKYMILVEDGLRCHESFKNNLYEKPSRTENSFTLSVIYRGPSGVWGVSPPYNSALNNHTIRGGFRGSPPNVGEAHIELT